MIRKPRDLTDLYLAPVALTVDAELEALSGLDARELHRQVALRTNREPQDRSGRADAMVAAVTHPVDLSGWHAGWTERGLELSHEDNRLVLGAPPSVHHYIEEGA